MLRWRQNGLRNICHSGLCWNRKSPLYNLKKKVKSTICSLWSESFIRGLFFWVWEDFLCYSLVNLFFCVCVLSSFLSLDRSVYKKDFSKILSIWIYIFYEGSHRSVRRQLEVIPAKKQNHCHCSFSSFLPFLKTFYEALLHLCLGYLIKGSFLVIVECRPAFCRPVPRCFLQSTHMVCLSVYDFSYTGVVRFLNHLSTQGPSSPTFK